MKKLIGLGLIVATLTACGSDSLQSNLDFVYDDQGRLIEVKHRDLVTEPLDTEESDLGTLQQQYSARRTANYQLGTQMTHSRLQCDRVSSSQACTILRGIGLNPRNVSYYIDPSSFTGAEMAEIRKAVEDIDTTANGWNFNEVGDTDPWPTLYFNDLPCTGSSSSGSISAFSCVNLTQSGENLAEGAGVVGTYTTHDYSIAHLDMSDIYVRTNNSLQELYMVRHAAGHAALASIGLGGRLDAAAAGFFSRMAVDPNWSGAALSAGEKCRLESLSGVGDGTFTLASVACSGAD